MSKNKKSFKVTFVLPAHNEEKNLPDLVEALFWLWSKYIYEIIIVNDSSSDNTRKVAESLKRKFKKIRIINRKSPSGVGYALRDGYIAVNPKCFWTLSIDSDFVYNVPELKRLFEIAKEGNVDGVIGSRYIKQSRMVDYPFLKKISNRIYHSLLRITFHITQKDLTNNFKLYKTSIFKTIDWQSTDFSINAETGLLPVLKGYKIVEVPVSWIQRSFGKSDFIVFKLALSYLKVFLRAFKCKLNFPKKMK